MSPFPAGQGNRAAVGSPSVWGTGEVRLIVHQGTFQVRGWARVQGAGIAMGGVCHRLQESGLWEPVAPAPSALHTAGMREHLSGRWSLLAGEAAERAGGRREAA